MNEGRPSPPPLAANSFSTGVLASTLTPFGEDGRLFAGAVTDQARRLGQIDGILGIAVTTTNRERQSLSHFERIEVIRRTKEGLDPNQIVLACVGTLSDAMVSEVSVCAEAGANAVIAFPPSWSGTSDALAFEDHLAKLVALTDRLVLPVIVTIDEGHQPRDIACLEVASLAREGHQVIGVDLGAHENVMHYDQAYYALKTVDRPLACLASSEAALFHNLNTGADGVFSSLAYIAPHEVAALYAASRDGQFHLAQAIHNRLAPLVKLLSGHGADTHEAIYREVAHGRSLLASPTARGLTTPLSPQLKANLHSTLDEIALKPISWI